MASSLVLLSGGVDSLVALAMELKIGIAAQAVAFDYGQRHAKELQAAQSIASHYGIPFDVVTIDKQLMQGSALTGIGEIPHAPAGDASQSATVVPGRNFVFAACAASLAIQRRIPRIIFGAHAGDAAIYPDCRPLFIRKVGETLLSFCSVRIEAPFIMYTKKAVAEIGMRLNAPLALSWSCYEGGDDPCGECGACRARAEAGL